MTTSIVLLRGIDVGTAKRVPMAELRDLLGELGYADVSTLLNSGNAVLRMGAGEPARHATRIAAAVEQRFGFQVPVVVRTVAELDRIVAECPFDVEALDPARLLVVFAQGPKQLAALADLVALAVPPERFEIGARAAYLACPDGVLASRVGEALLGTVGAAFTTRNWSTVQRVQARARDVDGRAS
jgi:uncharacterized protein (DUF1697 family)